MNVTELLRRLLVKIENIYLFKIIIIIKNMVTSLKTGFAQIFFCCPKKPELPKLWGAAAHLAPPARTPMALLLKRREFGLELKRGDLARVQTEMVEIIALPIPFSNRLKIWSFHVVVLQEQQRNVQKSVMHVQSFCFAH